MILGVDIGNCDTKSSTGFICPSKCSRSPGILKSTSIVLEDTFYIGDGNFDTEYRKIKKEYTKPLFYHALTQSTKDQYNKVVVGLPLSQYKQDKDRLKEMLSGNAIVNGRKLTTDIEVYPEGLGAVADTFFQGVIIDIGGKTTDAAEIINSNVHNPFSLPSGTMNLYADFIKSLNVAGLDLRLEDAERILQRGLKIDGLKVNIEPSMEVFKQFVNDLVNRLQIEYSIRTRDVLLIGGGCQLLYQALKNRIPGASIITNPVFANAIGFQRVGESLWL